MTKNVGYQKQNQGDRIVSAGIRSVYETGNSATIGLPRADIEEILGIAVEEELLGSSVTYQLHESGKLIIQLDPEIATERAPD